LTKQNYYILGVSCFYHDSAVTLINGGEIVFAAQEERFSRIKHDSSFPKRAIEAALDFAKIDSSDLKAVTYYEDPNLKSARVVSTIAKYFPRSANAFVHTASQGLWRRKLVEDLIRDELNFEGSVIFGNHHLSHAASAFFPSSFETSAILTMDGTGEWATSTISLGRENKIELLREQRFPDSLGLLYSSFTKYCGFKVNSGEYKLMGLAPYGSPIYVNKILDNMVSDHKDGSLSLNMKYFDFPLGEQMINKNFEELFGHKTATAEESTNQFYMDMASSIQQITENIVVSAAKFAREITGSKNLCLAGGVALNCVANGRIIDENIFENIWIQPAAGDAGGSLGSALNYWYQNLGNIRDISNIEYDSQSGSYLGTEYSDKEIEKILLSSGAKFEKLDESEMVSKVSQIISEGKVVGWFQGRMEFGPRALGARSILGDARSPQMQSKMNLKIKFRESFRPFAPSILESEIAKWFKIPERMNYSSPYMLQVAGLKEQRRIEIVDNGEKGIEKLRLERSEVPAVTHVDYSARLQSVNGKFNQLYFKLISSFFSKTNVPIIVNTSFNVRGEPIVESPKDAYLCFMRTEMDFLSIGSYLLRKSDQPKLAGDNDWREQYALD
jgi:carbamoyltransferase